MSGIVPCRSSGYQSIVSFCARSCPRVNVLVVPGIETAALSSAGSAEGGGGPPGGGGGVYAQSGRPAGIGALGSGAAGCCATIDAPRIMIAIATRALTAFFMFLSFWSVRAELAPAESTPVGLERAVRHAQGRGRHREAHRRGLRLDRQVQG